MIKKLFSDLIQVLHILENKLFWFWFKFFFMKELRGGILSENHWRSQGVAEGIRAPSIKIHQWQKFVKKALFLHFQFLLASLRTTVNAYNSN